MAQAADLHLPPAGAFDHFDLDFHRGIRLTVAIVPPGGLIRPPATQHGRSQGRGTCARGYAELAGR